MWIAAAIVIIAGFAGAVARGRRTAARLRDDALQRLPVGVDGIIPGAEAFELARGGEAPAILLLHGGGDTPQTLRYLAEYLYARGYHVRVPLLPGHGRTVTEFCRFSLVTAERSRSSRELPPTRGSRQFAPPIAI